MEFENLQIEVPTGDNASQYMAVKIYEKKYHNRSKGFVVGFDPNTKEYIERKQRRAKRFGCKSNQITAPQEDAEKLSDIDRFKGLDLRKLIWPPVPEEVTGEIRAGAILLYGVEHMSTSDVFEYFKLFGPETIEWIDDYSCNVVWDDTTSVTNALDGLSKTFGKLLELQRKANAADHPTERPATAPISVFVKDEDEDEKEGIYENRILIEDEELIDPKDIWRVGLPFNENQLFLRYASTNDRKLPGAAQRSEYYLKYGRNANNESNVAGVLSNSRKRKLQQMQKLAVERFKTKEPDVKIVDLAELKTEGIVSKMEVDEDEEPVIKRLNVDSRERISMTMVADKVEVQQRLGDRYAADTVHDRLGTPLPDDNTNAGIHDRLGGIALDRIGRRNNTEEADARDDIHHTRRKHHNNQTYLSGGGYIDGSSDYHDVYLAEDLKSEAEDEKEDYKDDILRPDFDNEYDHDDRHKTNYHDSNSELTSRSSVRNRLGTPRLEASPPPVSDLRDKLRRRERTQDKCVLETPEAPVEEENIKDEDGEKVNLCIEIKREPHERGVPMEDEDEEEEFEF